MAENYQFGQADQGNVDSDFELHPVTLKFSGRLMERRFEESVTLRARQFHDGMWLIRAWLVVGRVIHELARVKKLSFEVYINLVFIIIVVVAYGISRRCSRFGEGTAYWQIFVVVLCGLHAIQFSLRFVQADEGDARNWERYYFLGLDFAIDAFMFSLLFGLRQVAAMCALIIDLGAIILCLTYDGPKSYPGAGLPGIIDAIIFVVALLICTRVQEKASRAEFARQMRHNIRHNIDLRAFQQPFSPFNLRSWIQEIANNNRNRTAAVVVAETDPLDSSNNNNIQEDNTRVQSALITSSNVSREQTTNAAEIKDEEIGLTNNNTTVARTIYTPTTTTTTTENINPTPGLQIIASHSPDLDGTDLDSSRGTDTEKIPPKDSLQSATLPSPSLVLGTNTTPKQRGTQSTESNQTTTQNQQQQTSVLKHETKKQNFSRFEALQNWEIDYERLRVVRKIGAGSAGHVYKGEYIGAVVAIKQLYSTYIDPSNLDEFSREVTLLHKLKHPHVLTFYGIARRDVYCYIVTEFCPYALDSILSGGRGNDPGTKAPPRLSVTHRVKIAHEVALALAYLHTEHLIHHDLKPANILLNSDFVARVSDFGLSQLVARESESSLHGVASKNKGIHNNPPTTLGGTAAFSAPEISLGTLKKGFQALSKLDVFSFGIVLAAIFAPNGDPYYFYVPGADRTGVYTPTGGQAATMAALKNAGTAKREAEIRHAVAHTKLRPMVPNALPPEIRPLMEKCWAHIPEERPSFNEVAQSLRAYLVRHKELEDSTPTQLPVGPEALSVVDE